MKKVFSILLAICMMFSLMACQQSGDEINENIQNEQEESENNEDTALDDEDSIEEGIYSNEAYINTWKSTTSENYITLKVDGTFEAVHFAYDLNTQTVYHWAESPGVRTGTFSPVSPTVLSLVYDDGQEITFIFDPDLETLDNTNKTMTYMPNEGEIPVAISYEEQLLLIKEILVGSWGADTTDYVLTFNQDDTFTLENQISGDFDSGSFSLAIDGGYILNCEGGKYNYKYFSLENNTINLDVSEDVKVGSMGYERIETNSIFSNEDIFTIKN